MPQADLVVEESCCSLPFFLRRAPTGRYGWNTYSQLYVASYKRASTSCTVVQEVACRACVHASLLTDYYCYTVSIIIHIGNITACLPTRHGTRYKRQVQATRPTDRKTNRYRTRSVRYVGRWMSKINNNICVTTEENDLNKR